MTTDTTDTIIKASVTTECTCEVYLGAEPDGTDLTAPADFCMGCAEDNREALQWLINTWLARQTIQSNRVRVYGVGMGWQRRDGWLITDVTSLLDSVRLNGDYTLNFTLNGKDLSAVRYSHDEPTGCQFAFKLITEEDEL